MTVWPPDHGRGVVSDFHGRGKVSGPGRPKKGWRCRLGLHSDPLTQGVVGYCTRPGCDYFVRVHQDKLFGMWTRYVEKPDTDSRPRGSPPPPPPRP